MSYSDFIDPIERCSDGFSLLGDFSACDLLDNHQLSFPKLAVHSICYLHGLCAHMRFIALPADSRRKAKQKLALL